jgi:hypothetical protein
MRLKYKCVGWAKRPGANAFGGVPTIRLEEIRFKKWWHGADAPLPTLRTDPPYELRLPGLRLLISQIDRDARLSEVFV